MPLMPIDAKHECLCVKSPRAPIKHYNSFDRMHTTEGKNSSNRYECGSSPLFILLAHSLQKDLHGGISPIFLVTPHGTRTKPCL